MCYLSEKFGSLVFNDKVMKERLPQQTYDAMQQAIKNDQRLDLDTANIVANAMKDWAIEKGATHFSHWFQPMTGITAEKHVSFITPHDDETVVSEFSGKELVKGEPDASSFPSGGLRATFEARGYTAWDPTSYAFIKDKTLCIPTAFCSFGGEALDKKTPLLRSMQAINKQALRVLKLFGDTKTTKVITNVGAEQEYFLIDKKQYDKRPDIIFSGRTLFGAKAPKGQELDDHYFGAIKPRIMDYMNELNEELWQHGIMAKTQHNEVAPQQFELVPVHTSPNIATDQNQLIMELMQRVAKKHGLVCLLHEKPFEGVNGSGKHNNWSITTNDGVNLLEAGETPSENAQFLLFLCAVIKAVDEYQDLLRISVASAGNDHRLGKHEAPPAIVSIFLGDELTNVLTSIENDSVYGAKQKQLFKVGVHVLPRFAKDVTDRNRTSPFAFCGNRFEFRMLGSTASLSEPNIVLNIAVAEELKQFADTLENSADFTSVLHDLIQQTIKEHKRIIFNGNGYDQSWIDEAKKRGLLNLPTTPDCYPYLLKQKNIDLFYNHEVLYPVELKSRYDIMLENYINVTSIEANTMIDMCKKHILPSVSMYVGKIANVLIEKKQLNLPCTYEQSICENICALQENLVKAVDDLIKNAKQSGKDDCLATANQMKSKVIPSMENVRKYADSLEEVIGNDWPYPTYSQILFNV